LADGIRSISGLRSLVVHDPSDHGGEHGVDQSAPEGRTESRDGKARREPRGEAEREAQIALEAERQYASMVVKYMKNKDQFNQFLLSVKAACDLLGAMALKNMTAEDVSESFRILHTIEGEAGTFSVREVQMASRESQHVLEPFKSGAVMGDWDRELYANSIISLQSAFEDFLAHNSGIIQLPKDAGRTVEVPVASVKTLISDLEKLPGAQALAKHCQDLFLKEPIEARLKYFEGLTQTVAERLGKKIHPLKIQGGDIRIHPEPFAKFFSSLVHAFRNAVDHGLESPEDREWGGKDPAGTITIAIEETGGKLKLNITDDGRGIDPAVIREKLTSKFPDRDFSGQTDEDVIQQVCMPGFSSRDSVGEFSGRGVGLDALREEVLSLGGTIYIKSKVGQGTTLELCIPMDAASGQLLRSA
jgi:two-component system chemotaxis sensor kinase CheA